MNDGINDFYTNSVQVTTGLYDVCLHFKTDSPVMDKEGKVTGALTTSTLKQGAAFVPVTN